MREISSGRFQNLKLVTLAMDVEKMIYNQGTDSDVTNVKGLIFAESVKREMWRLEIIKEIIEWRKLKRE
jgi:hypothetical protein